MDQLICASLSHTHYWYEVGMLKVVVVVVFFTLTDRASTIPSNIRGSQSGTWSQRGTKVNGSHHDDNPATQTNREHVESTGGQPYNDSSLHLIMSVPCVCCCHPIYDEFKDWGGGGDVAYLSPFWEGTARN